MKKLFIIGNWKSYKTILEAQNWLSEFASSNFQIPSEREVIVCASFTLLSEMQSIVKKNKMQIKLGVQNVSSFGEGAYTGEISAKQAADLVTHAIVGHSERRRFFHETDDDVIAKIQHLLENKITPILCVSDMKQLDYYLVNGKVIIDNALEIIFVYEPPSAISGGGAFHPEDPNVANKNASEISQKVGKRVTTLYGGSITPENASEFFDLENIDGGLVGQASLDPKAFIHIVRYS